jgi:hypothetical protein
MTRAQAMTVKKQPEHIAGELCESANDWFRQFLKHVEIFMVETGQALNPDSELAELRLAAMRTVKLALRDSGADEEELVIIDAAVEVVTSGSRAHRKILPQHTLWT